MSRPLLVLLALLALTAGAYWQVGSCGFVGYDDPSYVRDEPMVNHGLRGAAVAWAFTGVHSVNWHPLTTLSHLLDVSIFGLQPGPMHWANLAWHLLNTALVFAVWQRLFAWHRGSPRSADAVLWPAATVAALFALHPLHVESVAWISERKDVLSTAWWLLALLAYLRSREEPTRARSMLVAIFTACAVMAKPMAVTLPFTLLLLDLWPLRRWPEASWTRLAREKWPLFLLVGALSVVVFLVQDATGATGYGESLSLGMRLGNSVVGYVRYLLLMLWPAALSPFYPHPGWWPWWAIAGSAVLLLGGSFLVWRERERRPWLVFGWCWYLGTLVPVIGLVQVGAQSIADRYTYVPLLGIFTMIVGACAEFLAPRRHLRAPAWAVAAVALAACGFLTWRQTQIWRTPVGLVEHMRAVIGDHPVVYREMATALLVEGRPPEEAMAQYRRGHQLAPDFTFFLHELGMDAAQHGRFDEARALLGRARELTPRAVAPHHNLAMVSKMQGRLDEALEQVQVALAVGPNDPDPRRLLADIRSTQGRFIDARDALLEAIRCNRWDSVAWGELGAMYARLDRNADALAALEHALWINPADEVTRANLAAMRRRLSR